jgi:GAF domain-containing protein/signal transduction histidine kinase
MSNKTAHRVLIVDDDLGFRKSLELRLQVEGYDTLAVAGARDALREIERAAGAYDLVLMDQRLESPWAGIEITRTITRRWPGTEVVVMTGYGDREASVDAMKAGACRYVYKTGKVVSEIVNIVEALDDMRELERQLLEPSTERGWLQDIILGLGCGIAIVDRSYRVLYLNDEAKRLVDKDAQIGGICWVEFYRAYTQDEPCLNCPVRALYEGREPIKVIKISASGDRYVEMAATPLRRDNKIVGAIVASTDVTDREHLFQMERGMVGTLSLDERLNVILQGIKVLGYDRVRLYLLSPDGEALVGRVQIGGTRAESFAEIRLPLGEDAYSRNVLGQKEPAIYKPGDLGPIPLWIDELLDKHGIPWIDLPLLVKGQPIGLISLDNKHSRRPLKKSELTRLMPYANSAAQAIVTAREHEAVRSRALELEKLREVDAEITRTPLEMREVLRRIVRTCLELTGADSGNIRLQEGRKLAQMARIGRLSAILGQKLPMSQDHIPCVWVARTGKRYIANQAQEDEHIIECRSKTTDESDLRILESLGSYVSYPLRVGGDTIGVLSLQSKEQDFFTDQICRMIEDFQSRAEIAIENAQLFEETQRRIRDLEIVNDIVQIIGTKLDTQDLLQAIVSQIADQLKCIHCTLFFPQKEKGELLLVPQVTNGLREEQTMTRRFKPGEGLVGWVFQHGESLVLPDAREDPRFSPARLDPDRPRSMLVAPVKVGDQTIGVISADQDEFGWFSESDRRLVDALARQVGIAIERATALGLLRDIGNRIISAQKVDDILQQIVSGAIKLTNTTSGVIHLTSEDGKSVIKSFQHPPDFAHPKPRMDKEEGVTRQVITTGETLVFSDIHQDTRVNPVLYDRFRSMIVIPLKHMQQVIGVLYLYDAVPHGFTETEVSLLSTLASQAAIAIVNARLLQNTSEALEERVAEMETLQDINDAITSTLELNAILEMILDRALELTRATCGTVQLVTEDGQALELVAERGATLVSIGERLKLGESVTGKAALNGRTYHISDLQSSEWKHLYCTYIPDTRSELAVPMCFEDQVVGVINIESADTNAFGEDDRRLLEGLAKQAAIAIRNAMRYRELEKTKDYLLASEAVAWLGLFGADWQHAINQKTFSIGNYVNGLRRWLTRRETPPEITEEIFHALDRIEKVAESIGAVQFTSQVPPEMPGEAGGQTMIDSELSRIVDRWCSGREDVNRILDLNCPGVKVRISPQWLRVAMEKLVNNAIKFVPSGGQLTVATHLVGDEVHITVKDTGPGIPDSVRPYFLKRAVPRREGESGTGMGALIARFVALSHGGNLSLVDSCPGKGTELLMALPMAVNGDSFGDGGRKQ